MNTPFVGPTAKDILVNVEQARRLFEAGLQKMSGIDFRVQIEVFNTTEPRAQELCDAGKELGWQHTEVGEKQKWDIVYDHVSLWHRTGEGVTLYGPDRKAAA